MRNRKPTAPFLAGNRIVVLLTALVVAVGLTGLTATAMAGSGDSATAAKKKKKKICPPGTHKVTVKKKKNGRVIKKKKCAPNASNTPAPGQPGGPTAALVISPTAFSYPGTQHNGQHENCVMCPTQAFTVTNAGGGASGPLAVSLQEVVNLIPGQPAAFYVVGNTCAAALAPGGTCSVDVKFSPNDNPGGCGDCTDRSILHVIGTPGGDAKSDLAGLVQG
jgi:hypothetical protein